MFESFSDVWQAARGLSRDAMWIALLSVGALGLAWLGLAGGVLVLHPLDAWQRRRRLRAQLAREDARREAMARPKTRLAEHPLNRAGDMAALRGRVRAVLAAKGEDAEVVAFLPREEIYRLLMEDAEFMAWDRVVQLNAIPGGTTGGDAAGPAEPKAPKGGA